MEAEKVLSVYNEPTERTVRVVQATEGLKSKSYYVKLTGNEINYNVTGEKLPNGKFKFKIISPEVPKQYQVKEQKSKGFTILEDADVFNQRKTALENAKTKKFDEEGNETDEEVPLYDEVRAVRQEIFIYDKLPIRAKSNFEVDRKLENGRYVYEIETDEEHFKFGDSTGSVDLLSDLVSYYKLDETSGTTATDAHGSNNGTANNSRIFTSETTGKINTCADFTQGNDYIGIPSRTHTLDSEVSASLWVNSSSFANFQGLYTYWGVGQSAWIMYVHGGGEFGVYSGQTHVRTTFTMSTNTWYHLAFSYNGTTLKMYINNVERASQNVSFPAFIGTGRIGEFRYDGSEGLNTWHQGLIDEAAQWSKGISTDEISALWNSGNGLSYDRFGADVNPNVKISGEFLYKPSLVKINGEFVAKPTLAKVGGTFV